MTNFMVRGYYSGMLNQFKNDERGVALILFALLAMVLIPLTGGVVDYAGALTARERLVGAADAAALAIAGQSVTDPERAKRIALSYSLAHYPVNERHGVIIDPPDVVFGGDGTVTVTIGGDYPTAFLPVIGIRTLPLNVAAEALATGQLELVMVLDNTGSMNNTCAINANDLARPGHCWQGSPDKVTGRCVFKNEELIPGYPTRKCIPGATTKIEELRVAARSLVDILFATEGVKLALVPFSSSVNVGTDKEHAWLDTAGLSDQHFADFTLRSPPPDPVPEGYVQPDLPAKLTEIKTLFDLHDAMEGSAWQGCVRARNGLDRLRDVPLGTEGWVPMFAPVSIYNPYITPAPPTSYEAYAGQTPIVGRVGPNEGCVSAPIAPLVTREEAGWTQQALHTDSLSLAIGAMLGRGNTAIPMGLVWGWRVLSPNEPYTEGQASSSDVRKVMVILTDGKNQIFGGFSAYGPVDGADHPTGDGIITEMQTLCTNIKRAGVMIYGITFGASGSAAAGEIETCVEPLLPPNPSLDCPGGCYAHAPDGVALRERFEQIGRSLGRLRLLK